MGAKARAMASAAVLGLWVAHPAKSEERKERGARHGVRCLQVLVTPSTTFDIDRTIFQSISGVLARTTMKHKLSVRAPTACRPPKIAMFW